MKEASTTIEVLTAIPGCGYGCRDFEIIYNGMYYNDDPISYAFRCSNLERCAYISKLLASAKEEVSNGKHE